MALHECVMSARAWTFKLMQKWKKSIFVLGIMLKMVMLLQSEQAAFNTARTPISYLWPREPHLLNTLQISEICLMAFSSSFVLKGLHTNVAVFRDQLHKQWFSRRRERDTGCVYRTAILRCPGCLHWKRCGKIWVQ